MKKTVAILLITVMALSFVACASKKIIGTWELTKAEGDGASAPVGSTWVFDDNGNFTISYLGIEEKHTYKVRGSKLYTDGDTSGYYKLSFSGDTMTFTGADFTYTLTKK